MATVLRGAFPQDDRYWRLEWIGRVHRNPRVPTELQIELAIAPLVSVATADAPTTAEARNLVKEERQFIRVGIGLLPNLIIGSIWKRQRQLPMVPYVELSFDVDLDPSTLPLVDALHKLGEKRWMIPPSLFHIPREMWSSRCVMIQTQTRGYTVVIPCIEVLRAWWIRSSAMANQLFSEPLATAREKIYDTHRSGIVNDRWTVMLRTRFGERDVWPAALLACNPEAFRQAQRLFDSIIRKYQTRQPIFLEMLPPTCSGTLHARGVDISLDSEKRFLVFDLRAIPYPEPVLDVEWDIENSNAKSENEKSDSKNWVFRPPVTREAVEQDIVAHDEEPEGGGGTTREEYSAPLISTSASLRRMPNQKAEHHVSNPALRPASNNHQHSSSLGTGGASTSSRLLITAKEQSETPQPRTVVGFEAIVAIRGIVNGYANTRCANVGVNQGSVIYPDGIRSRFPTRDHEGKINWSFVEEHARQAIILEIEHENLFGYAVETELRPAHPGGSPPKAYCLAFLSAPNQRQLTEKELQRILYRGSKAEGIWARYESSIDGHDLTAFKHTREPEVFALLLLNTLRSRAGLAPLPKSPHAKRLVDQSASILAE